MEELIELVEVFGKPMLTVLEDLKRRYPSFEHNISKVIAFIRDPKIVQVTDVSKSRIMRIALDYMNDVLLSGPNMVVRPLGPVAYRILNVYATIRSKSGDPITVIIEIYEAEEVSPMIAIDQLYFSDVHMREDVVVPFTSITMHLYEPERGVVPLTYEGVLDVGDVIQFLGVPVFAAINDYASSKSIAGIIIIMSKM
ncbi:MAG: hypothetical protein DRI01_04570 [Chloroflexi bacterium]|nr:MAG: hypothetical protein DRI01_04570 [Chloroflexota bacterium]